MSTEVKIIQRDLQCVHRWCREVPVRLRRRGTGGCSTCAAAWECSANASSPTCRLRWQCRCPSSGFWCTFHAGICWARCRLWAPSWVSVASPLRPWDVAAGRAAARRAGVRSKCCRPDSCWRWTIRRNPPSCWRYRAGGSWAEPTTRAGCSAEAFRWSAADWMFWTLWQFQTV